MSNAEPAGAGASRAAAGADEADLVRRARGGDLAAFGELVRLHQQPLARYVFALLRDWAAAEDVVQDAFVRAYRALPAISGALAFRPWLYRIASNRARDHLRRVARRPDVALEVAAVVPARSGPAVEERDLVRAALAALSPRDRAVLVLCGAEGYSYAEAAAILGIGADAARKRFTRARSRFRRAYERLDR